MQSFFALGEERNGVLGDVLDGRGVADLFSVVQVPTMTLMTRFVEPFAELLIGYRSAWRRGIDGTGKEVVLGVGGGREGLFVWRAFVDVEFLELYALKSVHKKYSSAREERTAIAHLEEVASIVLPHGEVST